MSDDGILHFNPWMDFNDGPPSENPFGCDPDPGQIAIFLDNVFSWCEGLIPLRGFVDKGQGRDGKPHNIWIPADDAAPGKLATFAAWANREGAAVYVIPGTVEEQGQARAADVLQMQAIVVDLDAGDIPAKLDHIVSHLGTPTLIVESGGRTPEGAAKLHVWWKLTEPAEGEDLATLCRLRGDIAVKVGGDTHFRSAHQPIRVPGTVYHKHGHQRLVQPTPTPLPAPLPTFSLGALLDDTSPMPEDIIGPRVLTPGGLLVLGGAPKVGKSDFLICWLVHMAAGVPFLGFTPPRPLRVFYLQAEIQYHYLRERMQQIALPAAVIAAARDTFIATPKLKLLLDAEGVARVAEAIRATFPGATPDIIVIDPIRNLFDGGPEGGGENDNTAMMFFLKDRVELLREAVNPDAGVILAHHTRKASKHQVKDDPFLALSGASALRGFYTSGLLMHRPDEDSSVCRLEIELRNGPALPGKLIDKVKGEWVELNPMNERLVRKEVGAMGGPPHGVGHSSHTSGPAARAAVTLPCASRSDDGGPVPPSTRPPSSSTTTGPGKGDPSWPSRL